MKRQFLTSDLSDIIYKVELNCVNIRSFPMVGLAAHFLVNLIFFQLILFFLISSHWLQRESLLVQLSFFSQRSPFCSSFPHLDCCLFCSIVSVINSSSHLSPLFSAPLLQELPGLDVSDADFHPDRRFHYWYTGTAQWHEHPQRDLHRPCNCEGQLPNSPDCF